MAHNSNTSTFASPNVPLNSPPFRKDRQNSIYSDKKDEQLFVDSFPNPLQDEDEDDEQAWSKEEDQLLLSNDSRNLSLTELSIILPNKSEMDINLRMKNLKEGKIHIDDLDPLQESLSNEN